MKHGPPSRANNKQEVDTRNSTVGQVYDDAELLHTLTIESRSARAGFFRLAVRRAQLDA